MNNQIIAFIFSTNVNVDAFIWNKHEREQVPSLSTEHEREPIQVFSECSEHWTWLTFNTTKKNNLPSSDVLNSQSLV